MFRRRALICLAVLSVIAIATVTLSAQPQVLALTAVNVVDVVAGRIVPDTTVVVTGDTITSVAQHGIPLVAHGLSMVATSS